MSRMKFFVEDVFVHGDIDFEEFLEASKPHIERYNKHLEDLKQNPEFPNNLITLGLLYGLDDALISSIKYDINELTITFKAGDLQMGYYDLIITFIDYHITLEDNNKLQAIACSIVTSTQYIGDLQCTEIDLAKHKKFAYRLLFHDFGVIEIESNEMIWSRIPTETREIPDLSERIIGDK